VQPARVAPSLSIWWPRCPQPSLSSSFVPAAATRWRVPQRAQDPETQQLEAQTQASGRESAPGTTTRSFTFCLTRTGELFRPRIRLWHSGIRDPRLIAYCPCRCAPSHTYSHVMFRCQVHKAHRMRKKEKDSASAYKKIRSEPMLWHKECLHRSCSCLFGSLA